MIAAQWTDADTDRAIEFWNRYQRENDVSNRIGETAGIDPVTGRVWFGESAKDIWRQMDEEDIDTPLYYVRVGYDYYVRKGGRR
jgi:hypothetical protein